MYLEKSCLLTTTVLFYYGIKFILRFQVALATSFGSFPGEVWDREIKKTVAFQSSQEKDKLLAITSSSQHFPDSSRQQYQCEKEMNLYRNVAKSS